MRNKNGLFFDIEAKLLMVGSILPMPTYIYLKRNDRFVPISSIGENFEGMRAAKIQGLGSQKLHVPTAFRAEFEGYLKACRARLAATEDTAVAKKILKSETLSSDAKGEMLAELARDLLAQAGCATWREDDPFANKLNALFEAALRIAGEKKPFYLHALQLKQLKSITDFSVFSSLISFLVAMCQRISAPEELADICLASLYRDLGNHKLAKAYLGDSRNSWDQTQRSGFESHIKHSLDSCGLLGEDLPAKIKAIIGEHHERFDGAGFPNKKWHHQIAKESQIVHCADLVALMVQGKLDGEARAMPEAIEFLYEECNAESGTKPVNPDVIWAMRYRKPVAA